LTDEIQQQMEDHNTMTDIRDFLMASDPPLQPGEFAEFWKSLTDEERAEFKNTPLR
jgi:hypothetical protein